MNQTYFTGNNFVIKKEFGARIASSVFMMVCSSIAITYLILHNEQIKQENNNENENNNEYGEEYDVNYVDNYMELSVLFML